ncbi:MAG: tetratricopeptide repeat protein [Chitinivibrionales bacterium]|nr:tetratricopeptide repeat protein [Chitinivibrionales bacterium]
MTFSQLRHRFSLLMLAGLLLAQCSAIKGTAPENYQEGLAKLQEGSHEDAYNYFEAAAKKDVENSKYHWAAARTAPHRNAAYFHTKAAWDNGMKEYPVLLTYVKLSFNTQEEQKKDLALKLFEQLPDSQRTPEAKAGLHFSFKDYEQAIEIWQKLHAEQPDAKYINNIARALMLSDQSDQAVSLLKQAREQNLLNETGYALLASNFAVMYRYKDIDALFNEMISKGMYANQAHFLHAMYTFIRGDKNDAATMLDNLIERFRSKDTLLLRKAELLRIHLKAYTKEGDWIKNYAQQLENKDDVGYRYARTLFARLTKQDTVIEPLEKLVARAPYSNFVRLDLAREYARCEHYEKAENVYKRLPLSIRLSPTVLVEYATVASRRGEDDHALVLLSSMHKKGMMTRPSLEMFRDLTFKKDLLEKSRAAQELLEKSFPRDVAVRWSRGIMHIRESKLDSARAIFGLLAKEYPDETRFASAQASILLQMERYQQVVDMIAQKKDAPPQLRRLQARALRKMEKYTQADTVYRDILTAESSPATQMEYAEFLVADYNKPEQAVSFYRKLISKQSPKTKQDSVRDATVMNNLAWTLLQSTSANFADALSVAEKAYELASDNPHVVDTYATALLKAEKEKDCIKLLENNALGLKEPKLLHLLGTAYEKTGNINKAVRTYQQAAELTDSSKALKFDLSEEDIQTHVQGLLE